jgi:hypothetical protein
LLCFSVGHSVLVCAASASGEGHRRFYVFVAGGGLPLSNRKQYRFTGV